MKKSNWKFALLAKAASLMTAFAVIASAAPCQGHYYQPQVPKALRK